MTLDEQCNLIGARLEQMMVPLRQQLMAALGHDEFSVVAVITTVHGTSIVSMKCEPYEVLASVLLEKASTLPMPDRSQ